MNEDRETIMMLITTTFALLFFVIATCYLGLHFKYATKLYCQSNYSNNVFEYEQCKKKDLVRLLQEEKGNVNAR